MSNLFETFLKINEAMQRGLVTQGNGLSPHFIRLNNRARAADAASDFVQYLIDSGETLKAREVLRNCLPVVLFGDERFGALKSKVERASRHAEDFEEFKALYKPYSVSHGGALKDHGIITLGRYHSVLSVLDVLKPATMLNIGCGDGVFDHVVLSYLAEVKYTIVDASDAEHVADALNALHGGRVSFHKASQSLTDWPCVQYDVVMAMELLEHVPDQKSFLTATLDRVLPGGHLVLSTPDASVWVTPNALEVDMEQHITASTDASIKALMAEVGLTEIQVHVSAEQHLIAVGRKPLQQE